MNKIRAEHLSRGAYVYVRQSTADQLQHNHESRRRQYALAERARALGFSEVVVIDDDLGISASGVSRPGFDRLLAAICRGVVGAVVSIEASRLARNGRDWHTLLEFCALVGSLLVDEDGIYDPRSPNDRLLLGMKGTLSEMELSLLRQRSLEALKLKAARGDLHTTVAVGYLRGSADRIERDPDLRIREAIALVFAKFQELHSVRQVLLWLRQESIALPAASYGPEGRRVTWKLPIYNTVLHILSNPVYAGAYAFGRTETRVRIEDGRKRVVHGHRRARSDWQVLITEHHEGYIDWATYEHNQRVIADNANMKGEMAQGALRGGETLLAGLLRCGHCGRKLHVAYGGSCGNVGRYHCRGAALNHGAGKCISLGSLRIDRAVGAEVVRLLTPIGIEAAMSAIEQRVADSDAKRRQLELAREQARYEVLRAQRQYDVVDPENRLVAGELERRWNERLAELARIEDALSSLVSSADVAPITEAQRDRLLALGADLHQAWNHPRASAEVRKRIVRAVLKEIVVRVDATRLDLKLHWQGGDHTELAVTKNRHGMHRWKTDTDTETAIHGLARLMADGAIASLLNRWGKHTAKGHTWTEARVRSFRNDHRIEAYREGEREERGELTLQDAAGLLQVSEMTVVRMIRAGLLPGEQLCKGAPWVIRRADLEDPRLQHAMTAGLKSTSTVGGNQGSLEFQ